MYMKLCCFTVYNACKTRENVRNYNKKCMTKCMTTYSKKRALSANKCEFYYETHFHNVINRPNLNIFAFRTVT